MKSAVLKVCELLQLAWALAGCGASTADAPPAPFPVMFSAAADDGDPLAGVGFVVGHQPFGATSATGELRRAVEGTEGQKLPVSVLCPPGYDSQETPPPLRLTRNYRVGSKSFATILYAVTCVRRLRDVAIIVHSDQGGDLPVEIDGKPLAVTSKSGVAHVLVSRDRDVPSLAVSLDTSAHPELRPQHPSRTFELAGRDAVVVFDQAFARAALPPPRRIARPARHIPYRVD